MKTQKYSSLLLLVLWFIPALALAQRYTVTDLGPLSPTGINSWAQVVGNYNGHAFIWARGRGMRDLGLLAGGTFSNAAAINDFGIVTGTADGTGVVISLRPDLPNEQCTELIQPFVWKPNVGMQGLGTILLPFPLPPYDCAFAFRGRAINRSGKIVGDVPVSWDLYAYGFSWTKTNGMTFFGDSWPPTFANGISNTGKIVGQNSDFLTGTLGLGHATVWNNGIETDLGALAAGGQEVASSANGVNDLGLIVGWATVNFVPCCWGNVSPVHATLWTPTGEMRDLGSLAADASSAAVRINLFGQVIGSSGETVYSWDEFRTSPFEVIGRPFIWTERSGMRDLNTLISQTSGWVLQSVTDINVWGQIVGSGTRNGQPHGYLLTPLNPFQVF